MVRCARNMTPDFESGCTIVGGLAKHTTVMRRAPRTLRRGNRRKGLPNLGHGQRPRLPNGQFPPGFPVMPVAVSIQLFMHARKKIRRLKYAVPPFAAIAYGDKTVKTVMQVTQL
jgi:hypothetical protein